MKIDKIHTKKNDLNIYFCIAYKTNDLIVTQRSIFRQIIWYFNTKLFRFCCVFHDSRLPFDCEKKILSLFKMSAVCLIWQKTMIIFCAKWINFAQNLNWQHLVGREIMSSFWMIDTFKNFAYKYIFHEINRRNFASHLSMRDYVNWIFGRYFYSTIKCVWASGFYQMIVIIESIKLLMNTHEIWLGDKNKLVPINR